MSNFYFLDRWPNLKKLGMQAENYITTDSNASMLKTRILGEQLIDLVLIALKVEVDKFATQDDKIKNGEIKISKTEEEYNQLIK